MSDVSTSTDMVSFSNDGTGTLYVGDNETRFAYATKQALNALGMDTDAIKRMFSDFLTMVPFSSKRFEVKLDFDNEPALCFCNPRDNEEKQLHERSE